MVACGSYSAPLLRTVGVDLPIYPGKGYSATFPLLRPEGAPMVSTIDDGKKIAMSRLGNVLRVAGTIELGGLIEPGQPVARARCHMLSRRIAEILPGVRHPHARRAATRSTGRACARHAHQHPLHRPDPRGQAVGECRATARWAGRTAQARARPWPSC